MTLRNDTPEQATARRTVEYALACAFVCDEFYVESEQLSRPQPRGEASDARHVLAWILVHVHWWTHAQVAAVLHTRVDAVQHATAKLTLHVRPHYAMRRRVRRVLAAMLEASRSRVMRSTAMPISPEQFADFDPHDTA